MKKSFWLPMMAIVTALVLTACLKNDDDVVQCTPNSLSQDQHVIDSFIMEEGIDYLDYDPTLSAYLGVSYAGHPDSSMAAADSIVAFKRVIRAVKGNQLIPVLTDSISQNNDGSSLRFSDFETTSPFYTLLTSVRKGGSMQFIYPSSANALGYWGCDQQALNNGTVIPAYSQIIIDYTLTGVKKSN